MAGFQNSRKQFSVFAITAEEKSPEAYAERLKRDMDNNPDGARFEFVFITVMKVKEMRFNQQLNWKTGRLDPNYNRHYSSQKTAKRIEKVI